MRETRIQYHHFYASARTAWDCGGICTRILISVCIKSAPRRPAVMKALSVDERKTPNLCADDSPEVPELV